MGPIAVETWVPEEELELWEIKAFAERLETNPNCQNYKYVFRTVSTLHFSSFFFFFPWFSRVEREKSQGLDPSKTSGTLKTAEEVKAHLENQLKQARLAAQQVTT